MSVSSLLGLLGRAARAVSIDQWRAIDRETEGGGPTGKVDGLALAVLVTVAVSLTLQEYYGQRHIFVQWFGHLRDADDRYWQLWGYAWWSGARVVGYVVLPAIVLLCFRQRLRDYYLGFRGFLRHLWIYGALFLAISPAVYWASKTPAFRNTYPFYSLAGRSSFDLWAWELLYGVQFLALEVFFRGFMLQGLRRSMGANAIFVMIVPYCMIHFQKPVLETLGAIGAGLILGTLAMRTRSIWGGVLIHVGVAVSMDLLALGSCPAASCVR